MLRGQTCSLSGCSCLAPSMGRSHWVLCRGILASLPSAAALAGRLLLLATLVWQVRFLQGYRVAWGVLGGLHWTVVSPRRAVCVMILEAFCGELGLRAVLSSLRVLQWRRRISGCSECLWGPGWECWNATSAVAPRVQVFRGASSFAAVRRRGQGVLTCRSQ